MSVIFHSTVRRELIYTFGRNAMSADGRAAAIDLATFEVAFTKCKTIKPLLW